MNITDISAEIIKKIAEIDSIRKEIRVRGETKAEAITNYEKNLAVTLIKMKSGHVFTIGNETICDPPVSIMDKIAKGIVWQEKLEMEKSEANYKSVLVNLEATQSQLNALQSLFRHLDNV